MAYKPTSFRFDENLKTALALIAERESRSVTNSIEWMAKTYFKDNGLAWPEAPCAEHLPASPPNQQPKDGNNEST